MRNLLCTLLFLTIFSLGFSEESAPTRILVAYYSETGNTEKLARAVREGAVLVDGVEVILRNVGDVTDEEIIAASGILVGTPVHWGSASAEARAFVIKVGNVLSAGGSLDREGRTAGAFCTGGDVASGKEMARLSILTGFLNQRFLVIGGVTADGFGSLGAEATTGGASEGLSEEELGEAKMFGERFARLTHKIHHASLHE